MTREESKKCNMIIHIASISAGTIGAGLAALPLCDAVVLSKIQTGMINELGRVFGKKIIESEAKAILASKLATCIGKGVTQYLWGKIPVAGNAINTVVATTLTESIGWAIANDFAREI